MKRRKWMALMLCAGIFMADFSGIPLKVSAEQVEQAETVLDDQGTQKDDGENTELIQETEDENNSEESPIETEPEERAAEDTTTEELPSTEVVTELKTTIVSNKTAREYVDRTVELTTNVEDGSEMLNTSIQKNIEEKQLLFRNTQKIQSIHLRHLALVNMYIE